MFLAHFSGWQHNQLMEMFTTEIQYWHQQAVEVHNELNTTDTE